MFNVVVKRDWRARLKDAATWQVRIEEDQSLRTSREFQLWLENDLNSQAFARVAVVWRSVEIHADAPTVKAIANNAISRLGRAHRPAIAVKAWAAAACACVVLVAVGGYVATRTPADQPVVYTTDSNGLRTVSLADGSRIWLDASSSVTVHSFSSNSRRITLDSGRAEFSVAHDKSRPFSVTAGTEVTTAVGTAFAVERLEDELLVTVTHGRVLEESVKSGASSHSPVSLVMGQQLVAKNSGKISVSQIDLDSKTAWQKGRIVLNDQPLSEAIERLNRYLNKQVVVDPAIANIKISGVFKVGDLPTFLNALTKIFPVDARQQNDGRTLLQAGEAVN